MEEVIKSLVEKVSSYNIFNNFFPGIMFCCIVKQTTRFSLADGTTLENLFIYYFIGMIISRIGSLFVEKWLKSLHIKNRTTRTKEPFLKFAPYDMYIEASESDSFIKILTETNNIYRTIVSVFLVAIAVKLYDWLVYDYIRCLDILGENLIVIGGCLIVSILFMYSYKKQTDYIRKRVEKYNNSKEIQ